MGIAEKPILVMVAPNGARKNKDDHPNLPVTAEELAVCARECAAAGASIMHMHVRNGEGRHSLDPGLYHKAISAIDAGLSDRILLQITTEAAGVYEPDVQIAAVDAVKPFAVSMALKELAPDAKSLPNLKKFLNRIREYGTSPQFILYSAGEVTRFLSLWKTGDIPFQRPFLLFVLGRYTDGQQSGPKHLDPFLEALGGHDLPWAACAFGKHECDCMIYAAKKGGHIRIGFENNLHLPDGSLAKDNAELVSETVKELKRNGFRPMTLAESRDFLDRAAQ